MDTDDVWGGLFGEDLESLAKRLEKMFSDMESLRGTDIKAYGYVMYRDSAGNRYVKEYGNLLDRPEDVAEEPLIDVSLEHGAVRVTVEIPGVSMEDIEIGGTKSTLSISTDSGSRKFSRVLALPCDVDPDSAKAEYNNGILEVLLTPADTPLSKKWIGVQ
ncbi:MAG: Hsp20/alpha crystallin family protein [Methanomassiliicoccaceae archaeon]|nr:Hsp20/alpha crystallin family protein [Methanomassiliicoccaceae archaeon]